MFTVTGFTPDDIPYRVQVGEEVRRQTEEHVGVAAGSRSVLVLLRTHEGQPVEATPTGPTVVLDISDPASVLAALHGLTRVTRVHGDDIPELWPHAAEGQVY